MLPTVMTMDTMGQKIKRACKDAGFSLAELARRIGVHSSTTSEWAREKKGRKPPLVKLCAIANATGKPLSYFVEAITDAGTEEDGDWYADTLIGLATMMGRDEAMRLLASAVPDAVRRREEGKRARHAAD